MDARLPSLSFFLIQIIRFKMQFILYLFSWSIYFFKDMILFFNRMYFYEKGSQKLILNKLLWGRGRQEKV